MRLSEAQKQCLRSVEAGAVCRIFDVWGGYYWSEGDSHTRWRKSAHDAPSTISALVRKGLIDLGENERPYSGRQIKRYVLTPAGRRALEGERG